MGFASRLQFQGKRLLIVDDNPQHLRDYAAEMRARGFEVQTLLGVRLPNFGNGETGFDGAFHNAEEFRALVKGMNIDAMLTDCKIINRHDVIPPYFFRGEEATTIARALKPGLPVIMHATDERNPLASKTLKQLDEQKFAQDAEAYKQTGGLALFYKGHLDDVCATFAQAFARGQTVA